MPEQLCHTPGPWKIRYGGMPNDEGFGIASDNAQNACMVAERWPCTTTKEDRERMIADAKLICEAPAMLAVLEQIEMHYPSGINPRLDDAMREVRRIFESVSR